MFHGDVKTVITTEDDKLITGTVQDCTPILENATRLRNEGLHGTSEMKHAARFPLVLVEKYCNDSGITFAEFMREKKHIRAMLSDPALSGFRIWEGRVQ
jgi:hypothetical protein